MSETNILALFDTESKSEDGAWLHLTVPGTDELAYADVARKKPLRIKLKGPDSDIWTAFQRKAFAKANDKDKRTNQEIAREDARLFARMTVAVENVPGYDKPDADLVEMYLKYKDIRVQALTFVMKRENFIGTPENV